VAEEVRVLEGVLRRGRDGASAAWLRAAQHEVDQAWLRWRRASGDASRLDWGYALDLRSTAIQSRPARRAEAGRQRIDSTPGPSEW